MPPLTQEDVLSELENKLIGAFIRTHECEVRVISGKLSQRKGISDHYHLHLSPYTNHSRPTLKCMECGVYGNPDWLGKQVEPGEEFFSEKELTALAALIDRYNSSTIIKKLGMENDTVQERNAPNESFHVKIYGTHVGGWIKLLQVGVKADFTDYDLF